MSSLLLQLEIALHDVDCPGHDETFEGHGDKYARLAQAAVSVLPPEREPYWLQDRKLIQESGMNIIVDHLQAITQRVGAAHLLQG